MSRTLPKIKNYEKNVFKNAPTLSIVAVHTEENKPPKVWKQKFHDFIRVLRLA